MFQIAAQHLLPTSLSVVERLDEYVLEAVVSGSSGGIGARVLSLLNAARGIAHRDSFEMHVDVDGDHEVVASADDASATRIAEHISANTTFVELTVKLVVRKQAVGGVLSLYNVEAFGAYLAASPVNRILDLLWQRFDGGLIFECFDLDEPFGSASVRFAPAPMTRELGGVGIGIAAREAEFSVYRESTHAAGTSSRFLPLDVMLSEPSPVEAVQQFFDRACAALCVMFLANSSQLSSADEVSYKVVGYKSVLGSVAAKELVVALPALYKIYSWVYSQGGSADKIGLARNVISLHVSVLENLRDDGEVWNAIQSNYQIYLKGNIAAYLDVKSRIAELLVDTSAKAHAVAQGLVSSFKSGVGLLVTFLLGVVVVNGVKDSGVEAFFSLPYFLVLVLILAVVSFWLIHEVAGAKAALKDSEGALRDILYGGFSKVLHEPEIEESLSPIVQRNEAYLLEEAKRIKRFWVWLCCLVLIFFAAGWIAWGDHGVEDHCESSPAAAASPAKYFGNEGINGCFWPAIPLLFPGTSEAEN